jgi:tRNA-uridine 2-sulfurtransferase
VGLSWSSVTGSTVREGSGMKRVVLAMSGGVDSSVAAHLLLEQGYDVVGVFMRHGEQSAAACAVDGQPSPVLPILQGRADHKQGCCSASDAEDARRVADRLDIPFYALDLQEDFRTIIDYFVAEYTAARTPNPCVMCNNHLKFGKLFEYADSMGADYVATGHYAQLVRHDDSSPPALLQGVDLRKDQSYVLFGVRRDRLERMLLPVGGFEKPVIRQLAGRIGLRVAEKRDSQEICFVSSGKHDEFVRARRTAGEDPSGDIITTTGEVVGRHPGVERFTIGQRKGLGVGMGEPYFVVRLDAATRQVVIGRKEELARRELTADRCNWLVPRDSLGGQDFRCQAKIRYNSPDAPATARLLPDERLEVIFDEPRYGVAPGQAVVCYRDGQVLGGGWIE